MPAAVVSFVRKRARGQFRDGSDHGVDPHKGSHTAVAVGGDERMVLSFDEITEILGGTGDAVEWVSATRSRRKMYSIKGSRGELSLKVGRDDFLRKMFDLTQA